MKNSSERKRYKTNPNFDAYLLYSYIQMKRNACLSMEYARKCNADLLLVTDSDCDRVGIAEHWGQTP